jgi:hypothetical protein
MMKGLDSYAHIEGGAELSFRKRAYAGGSDRGSHLPKMQLEWRQHEAMPWLLSRLVRVVRKQRERDLPTLRQLRAARKGLAHCSQNLVEG